MISRKSHCRQTIFWGFNHNKFALHVVVHMQGMWIQHEYSKKMLVKLNKKNTEIRNFNYVSRAMVGTKTNEQGKKTWCNKNFLKPQGKQHKDNQHFICVKVSVERRKELKKGKKRSSFSSFFLARVVVPHAKSTKWKIPWIFITEEGFFSSFYSLTLFHPLTVVLRSIRFVSHFCRRKELEQFLFPYACKQTVECEIE